jgi:hypothetical protein
MTLAAGPAANVSRRMRRTLLVFVLVAAAIALAGCTKKIDTSKAEQSIKAGLDSKARRGITIASVRCPGDINVKKGNNFACTVTATNGRTASVKVVQTDDKGNVTYSGNLAALAGH